MPSQTLGHPRTHQTLQACAKLWRRTPTSQQVMAQCVHLYKATNRGQVSGNLGDISSRLIMQSRSRPCEARSPAVVGVTLQLLHFGICMHCLGSRLKVRRRPTLCSTAMLKRCHVWAHAHQRSAAVVKPSGQATLRGALRLAGSLLSELLSESTCSVSICS